MIDGFRPGRSGPNYREGFAARRSTLSRERFSPLALLGRVALGGQCPLVEETRTCAAGSADACD
jgi:hypothetical protein